MKLPLRPSRLTVRRQTIKWIILHHTSEIYKQPAAKIDNSTFQTVDLIKGVLEDKSADINYHYIIEKIKDDFYPIVARPFPYLCEWDDIDDNINNRALHVAVLGNYDIVVPEKRMYEILAYKVLNPFIKMYHIPVDHIKFHNEVSSNEDITCPGDFMDQGRVISLVRRFVVK